MKVTRVNRMLQFEERNFIKPYIDLNTSLRRKANNNFEKDFYKLINNSVFGKTMENVKNRQKIDLCTSVNKAVKKINRASFKKCTIFDKTTCKLMAVYQYQSQVKFDKPICIVFTVLQLSKQMMYNFHYNIMKTLYNDDDIKILYTDTDCFIYHIKTEDVYTDIEIIKDHFDTPDFPKDHYLYSEKNKKVIGILKDELVSGGNNSIPIMTTFIGLKSKTYSYKIETNNKHAFAIKAKGIKIHKIKSEVKEKNINHND